MTPETDTAASTRLDRRSLLSGTGLAATAAAVVTVLRADDAEAFYQAPASERAARYHETEHVKKFYELNAR